MKVLTIGATGFIGSHVVSQLVMKGHQVALFHRGNDSVDTNEREAIVHIYGNRDNLPDFKAEFERFAPDVVLDLIPYTERQAEETIRVFKGSTQRLVAISSGDVYRNYNGVWGKENHLPDPIPLTENAPLRQKLYPYRDYEGLDFEFKQDYDKILVENIVMNTPELPGTILRLPAVYGAEDRQHRFLPYLQRMFDRRPVILLSEGQASWYWTHGYVENLAAAIALAITDERAMGRIYNIGERETPTQLERLQQLSNLVGWSGEIFILPKEQLPRHLQMNLQWQYHMAIDTNRIREELGYVEPISNAEALRRTIAWERENLTEAENTEQLEHYRAEDEALNGI